ncbi:MAG: hypothetical protein ABI687_13475 [Flavitalea sp.]
MTKLLFLFLLTGFCQLASAQKNPCRITVTTDSAANVRRAQVDFSVVSNETDNLFCTAFRAGPIYSIYFGLEILNKPICFKPGSKAIIIFTDNSQAQLINEQGENCKGNFLVNTSVNDKHFVEKAELFNALTEKVIKGIRFYSIQGFVDYDVTEYDDAKSVKDSDGFRKSLACLKDIQL